MYTILNLFGRSPFEPLQTHMKQVSACVHLLIDLFEALRKKDFVAVEILGIQISEQEHAADITKNEIRNNLPKGLFLPIERGHLLEILTIQDEIASHAEDVGVLLSFKQLFFEDAFEKDFYLFLEKNIEAYEGAYQIIKELHDLLESSFGGSEAEKVNRMVEGVAKKEHEADILQKILLKKLYSIEDTVSFGTFMLWQKVFRSIASISDLSEKLSYRIRMTLELKQK